jgi:hypothetical protein
MRGSEETLDEYDVHDKEYDHAYSNKYLRTGQPLSLLCAIFGENKSLEGNFSFLGELLFLGNFFSWELLLLGNFFLPVRQWLQTRFLGARPTPDA